MNAKMNFKILNENEKNPLSIISMERNPKENLFSIIARNYFKIFKLNDKSELNDMKINIKNKLSYANILWDINNKNILYILGNPITNQKCKRIISPFTNLYSLDLDKGSKLTEEFKFEINISRLSKSNHNDSILACCPKDDDFISLVDLKNKQIISTIKKDNAGIICDCKFSPFDENSLLFSTKNGKIYLYDIRNLSKEKASFCSELKEILSISWHPTEKNLFCSGSMDNYIRMWDINNDISPLIEFKTSKGCSKVHFFKSNLNYIMCSYQTDNYNIDFWNTKIRDMPEYQFSGHTINVIGFDNDIEGKRLISCDKKGMVIIRDLHKGIRTLDNITTNIIRFNDNNEIYCFHDNKLKKEDVFELNNINIDITENNKDNSNIQSKLPNKIEKFNKEDDNIKNIYMLNFNQPEFLIKNKVIEQDDKKVYLKNDIILNINNELRQYYIFNKDQIHSIFKGYIFFIEKKETMYKRQRFEKTSVEINVDEMDFSEKLFEAINRNLDYAKNTINNYNHISIWNTLLFLSKQKLFKQLYDKYNGKEEKNIKKRFRKNKKNKEKIDFNNYTKLSPFSEKLMTSLFVKQLSEIIDYLIDIYGDIYLATIICYLFKPILFKDEMLKIRILRLIKQCVSNLRKYQLYVAANYLIKYGPEENNKTDNKNDFKFIFSCKNCGRNNFREGKCVCGKVLLCEECHNKTLGLFIWCSGCGHGGHINHINKAKSLYSCKACNHNCI